MPSPASLDAALPLSGWRAIAMLAAAQLAVWTIVPALVHASPPLDVVEGYMWGRSWPLATYKHPALPAWLLEASRLVTGATGWPALILSQLFVAATFAGVYGLGLDLLGAPRALAAALLATTLPYLSWFSPEFNHNVALMPLVAGFAWALWRAVVGGRALLWIVAAVLAAAMLHAKLAAALHIGCGAAWLLADPRARRRLASPAPWLALAVFLALVTPLAAWLVANDFLPLAYATERAQRKATMLPLSFVGLALGSSAGIAIGLALAGLIGRPDGTRPGEPAGTLRFLAFLAAGPLAGAVILATALQTNLKGTWVGPLVVLLPLVAVRFAAREPGARELKRLALLAAALLVAVPAAYAVNVQYGSGRLFRPPFVGWPQREIAAVLQAEWARETGAPLRIVSGEMYLAGLVALDAPGAPEILTDCRLDISPWITPERLAREGALVVTSETLPPPLKSCESLIAGRPRRSIVVPWRRAGVMQTYGIFYVIVPPRRP